LGSAMRRRQIGAILLFILMISARIAASQGLPQTPPGVPIYDPVSKRYFALMGADQRFSTSMWSIWTAVKKQAESQVFKGVRGRLAVVDSSEVHEFLLQHFHPDQYRYTWIGLEYHCRKKQLQWSNGQTLAHGEFSAWAANWRVDKWACSDTTFPDDYAAVAYDPHMRWVLVGRHKGYDYYFVEFPTGQE
jgi:hypothetical protein